MAHSSIAPPKALGTRWPASAPVRLELPARRLGGLAASPVRRHCQNDLMAARRQDAARALGRERALTRLVGRLGGGLGAGRAPARLGIGRLGASLASARGGGLGRRRGAGELAQSALELGDPRREILLLAARRLGHRPHRLELLARDHVHVGEHPLHALAHPALDFLAHAGQGIERAVGHPGQIVQQAVLGLHGWPLLGTGATRLFCAGDVRSTPAPRKRTLPRLPGKVVAAMPAGQGADKRTAPRWAGPLPIGKPCGDQSRARSSALCSPIQACSKRARVASAPATSPAASCAFIRPYSAQPLLGTRSRLASKAAAASLALPA